MLYFNAMLWYLYAKYAMRNWNEGPDDMVCYAMGFEQNASVYRWVSNISK